MPSLFHRSPSFPIEDLSNSPLQPGGERRDQRHPRWGLEGYEKQQSSIYQPGPGIVPQFLLALGVSLMGGLAIATQAPGAIAEPTRPLDSVTLPHPLAQGMSDSPAVPDSDEEEEAIQGDSEARRPASSKGSIYTPIRLKSGNSVEDILTTQDIPMGQGSFARDYVVTLKAKDQIAIDLFSDSFDTVVMLMSENGTTLGENDDGPDGGTNSLLFMRITEDGDYVVRVRGFGQAKGGPFKLKLTRLKAAQ